MKNRIKEIREEKSMTQLRLSVELGVAQETISAYEIGKHYPGAKALIQLSNLFSTSIDYILGLSDIRLPVSESCLPDDEAQLLNIYRNLNITDKEKALSYMRWVDEN